MPFRKGTVPPGLMLHSVPQNDISLDITLSTAFPERNHDPQHVDCIIVQ